MGKFSLEVNGYNREEVNQFLSELVSQTDEVVSKYREQSVELSKVNEELKHYKELEETLKMALVQATDASDKIKRLAREQSNVIVDEAKNNANRIVNDALLKAKNIENQADLLEKNMKIFKKKLKLIIEQQMAVVDEIEVLELDPQ